MRQSLNVAIAAALLATASIPVLELSLMHPTAVAQAPATARGTVTVESLSFKGPFATISLPRIVVEDTNATKAEIEALFDPARLSDIGTRMSRISARNISIPLIEIRQDTPQGTIVTAYRDTVMRNVRNGIIEHGVTPLTTSKGPVKAETPGAKPMDVDMTVENMVLKGFDLGMMLRAFFEKGQPGEPMKVAAVEQSIGRTSMRVGTDFKLEIASTSIRDFTLRALEKPLMTAFAEVQQNEKAKVPDLQKKNLALLLPVLTMMGIGTTEVTGVTAEFRSPMSGSTGTFSLHKVTLAGRSLLPEKFSIQGLRVNADGSRVHLGEVGFDGLDMSATFAAIQNGSAETDPSSAMPKLNLIRLGGIDIDVPDTKNAGQRVKAKLGLFETRMGNHVGPIPANIGMTLDRFQFDIPPETREKGLQNILALGYKALDLSARYEQVWDEAAKSLNLSEFTVRAADMFSLTAKAELANVARELFTTDRAKATVAALGLNARSLEASLTNSSLVEKIIAQQAKDLRRTPEDVRAEFAAGATLVVPMLLGDHPAARTIGPILGKFIADPKNLKVKLTAKGPNGIGATDFIAVANPVEILKKVDITASANE